MKKLLYILIFILAVMGQGWCATKYLRSIGGNFSDNATWSTTSNGAADTTAPTSSDDVVCDPNSGSVTLTINTDSYCKTFTCTGFTGTLAGGGAINFFSYGNIILSNTMTVTFTGYIRMWSSGNLSTKGINLPCGLSVGNNSADIINVLDDINQSSNEYGVRLYAGTLNTNNYTISCRLFGAPYDTIRTFNLGSSTINCSSLDISGTSTTLTANTATINCTGAFAGGGKTYGGTVNLTGTSGIRAISGANTFGNLSITGAANPTGIFTFGANQTVTGTFTSNGNSAVNKLALKSSDTTVRTIAAATVNVSNIDYYQNIKGAGDGWIGKVPFFNSASSWNPTMKYSGVLR